ncbi:hypothetical protein D3C77_481170 [compost metagenome]
MHADVDQRAPSGAFAIGEPSARVAEAANEASFSVINVAKITGIDEFLQYGDISSVAAHIADLEQLAGFAHGLFDLLGFVYGFAERFFAKYVFACLQCSDANFRMGVVPRADADRLYVLIGKKLIIVGVNVRDIVFFGDFTGSVLFEITDSNQLYFRIGLISLQMGFRD